MSAFCSKSNVRYWIQGCGLSAAAVELILGMGLQGKGAVPLPLLSLVEAAMLRLG
jgi:hypothetical protein